MTPQLIIIHPAANNIPLPVPLTPSDLNDGCPRFDLIRTAMGVHPDTTLEPVRVVYEGTPAWMFVDEDGIRLRLPPNERASRIAPGHMILGPAAIWTGELT